MHAFVATVPVTLIEAVHFVVEMNIKDADVYITKSFADAEVISSRLAERNVFQHVYLVEDVLLTYPITVKKCWQMVKNGRAVVKEIKKRKYGYAYYNNSGWLVNSIFYTGFFKGNKECAHRFIEHGYNTYLNEYGKKPWYLRPLIHLAGYKCMDGSMLEALYMFDPSLLKVHQDGEIRTMPYMDKHNKRFVDTLNYVFGFNPVNNEFKDKKILIMEQGPMKVGFDIEKFWTEILGGINKDEAIIKAHPRQKKSALQNMGIEVSKNSTIPWEVAALGLDMENKVQMAVFSGSCIMPKTCCNIESTVILLYKLLPVDYRFLGEKIVALTEEIGEKYSDRDKFFVPESIGELRAYFREHNI